MDRHFCRLCPHLTTLSASPVRILLHIGNRRRGLPLEGDLPLLLTTVVMSDPAVRRIPAPCPVPPPVPPATVRQSWDSTQPVGGAAIHTSCLSTMQMAAQWQRFASDVEMPPLTEHGRGQPLFDIRVDAPGGQPDEATPETVSVTGDGEASLGSGPSSEPTAQPVRAPQAAS